MCTMSVWNNDNIFKWSFFFLKISVSRHCPFNVFEHTVYTCIKKRPASYLHNIIDRINSMPTPV